MLIEKLHSFLNSYDANGTKLTCFFKSQLYIVCQMDLDIFCAFCTFVFYVFHKSVRSQRVPRGWSRGCSFNQFQFSRRRHPALVHYSQLWAGISLKLRRGRDLRGIMNLKDLPRTECDSIFSCENWIAQNWSFSQTVILASWFACMYHNIRAWRTLSGSAQDWRTSSEIKSPTCVAIVLVLR